MKPVEFWDQQVSASTHHNFLGHPQVRALT